MSIYKQFLAQDIIITPFKVNKNFMFTGSSALTGSNVGIERLIGTNLTGSFNLSDPTTGTTLLYQRLLYNSIKTLYYSNYISSSIGDEALPTIIDNGIILQINNIQPRFFNYLQSTLTASRFFPTGSNDQVGIVSIPSTLFGENIRPGTFVLNSVSGSLRDDGEGNLISSSLVIGNIIYSHGIAIITRQDAILPFISSSILTMSFDSTYTIHETQYKCTIRESEFNYSYNKSLLSGSIKDQVKDFVTSSFFNPYITTVGLYNDNQDLLAIAKLSQPLPSSRTTDMNIIINIDR
jgi:hypothetical protein